MLQTNQTAHMWKIEFHIMKQLKRLYEICCYSVLEIVV